MGGGGKEMQYSTAQRSVGVPECMDGMRCFCVVCVFTARVCSAVQYSAVQCISRVALLAAVPFQFPLLNGSQPPTNPQPHHTHTTTRRKGKQEGRGERRGRADLLSRITRVSLELSSP